MRNALLGALLALAASSCTSPEPTPLVPSDPPAAYPPGAIGPGGEPERFDVELPTPDLGTWTALGAWDTTEGRTDLIPVEIDVATTSFYPLGISEGRRRIALVYAEDPDGTVWVDVDRETLTEFGDALPLGLDGLFESPNRSTPASVRSATLFPNNPSVEIRPGTWLLQFGTYDRDGDPIEDVVEVGVLEREQDPSASGVVDLAFHLSDTDVNGLDIDTLPDAPGIVAMVDLMESKLAGLGLQLGEVSFTDASHLEPVAELDTSCVRGRAIHQTWQNLGAYEPGAINILLVDEFRCGLPPVGLGGLSGGLPGIPLSTTDGVFVSTLAIMGGVAPDVAARIGVHEVFHFMGLFHTIEQGTDLTDALDDTDGGESNLMFPTTGDGAAELTADQEWVLRRSAWVGAP